MGAQGGQQGLKQVSPLGTVQWDRRGRPGLAALGSAGTRGLSVPRRRPAVTKTHVSQGTPGVGCSRGPRLCPSPVQPQGVAQVDRRRGRRGPGLAGRPPAPAPGAHRSGSTRWRATGRGRRGAAGPGRRAAGPGRRKKEK